MTTSSIIARLDRELAPRGFTRKKATWNRVHGPLVEVVDVQTSKGGDTVTMNFGVLSRPIYFACWGRDAKRFVEEPECTVRVRVGHLIDNKDRWWDVGNTSTADEMVKCLVERALPFLERMQSLEEMRDWLASMDAPSSKYPPSAIYFAVLQSQLGDLNGACTTLTGLERRALGAWKGTAKEVSIRLGCDRVMYSMRPMQP